MALNTQLDSFEFPSMSLPFDTGTRDLDNSPRLVAGSNMLATQGGKLTKRPGFGNSGTGNVLGRVDRLVIIEDVSPSVTNIGNILPTIVLVASVLNTSTNKWELWKAQSGAATWTKIPAYRDSNNSAAPHDITVYNGRAYIRCYGTDVLGTVSYSPSVGVLEPWGLVGPSVPARLGGVVTTLTAGINASVTSIPVTSTAAFPSSFPFTIQMGNENMSVTAKTGTTFTVTRGTGGTVASSHNNGAEALYRDWVATTQPVTVNFGWKYVYAWKTGTGQVSARSPVETNPDYRPSNTGGFTNVVPKIVVQGHADTNVTSIIIYRTTDAGGAYLKVGEVANTGAGNITVSDNFLTTLGGNTDPLPDSLLNTSSIAPSLTSNTPPPGVLAPNIVGVDTPFKTTRMATYANRIWYGLGSYVFFSGNEEITEGNPLESFPSGTAGNFFKFPHIVTGVIATDEALYVITSEELYWIRGNTRDTFSATRISSGGVGGMASTDVYTTIENQIAWVASDGRVYMGSGTRGFRCISFPVQSLINNDQTGSQPYYQLLYVNSQDKNLLIFSNGFDTQWVYDLNLSSDSQPFWHTPWTAKISMMAVGSITASVGGVGFKALIVSLYGIDLFARSASAFGRFDFLGTACVDWHPNGSSQNYACSFTTNLMANPAGDHVNLLRRPALTTTLYGYILERTKFTSDTDPVVRHYINDFYTTPLTPTVLANPSRRSASIGYKSLFYTTNTVCNRVAINVSKVASSERFEVQSLAISFNPDAGV